MQDKTNKYKKASICKARHKKIYKKMCYEYFGSKCCSCNYNKCFRALEFHHIESDKKEEGLSKLFINYSPRKIFEEVIKCILICSNCHREYHAGITDTVELVDKKIKEYIRNKPEKAIEMLLEKYKMLLTKEK